MRLHAFLNENHACFTACIGQSLPLTSVYVLWTRFTNGKLPGVKRKSGLTLMWPTHSRLQSQESWGLSVSLCYIFVFKIVSCHLFERSGPFLVQSVCRNQTYFIRFMRSCTVIFRTFTSGRVIVHKTGTVALDTATIVKFTITVS